MCVAKCVCMCYSICVRTRVGDILPWANVAVPVSQWIQKGVHLCVIPIHLTESFPENWYAYEYLLPSLCRCVLMDSDSCVAIIDVPAKHNESEITPQQ